LPLGVIDGQVVPFLEVLFVTQSVKKKFHKVIENRSVEPEIERAEKIMIRNNMTEYIDQTLHSRVQPERLCSGGVC
jgi:hypothetical protein